MHKPATTKAALQELFDFTQAHPSADIEPHVLATSSVFQDYIRRGLKLAAAKRATSDAAPAAGAPGSPKVRTSASSPALSVRERLNRIKSSSSGPSTAASAPATPAPASPAASDDTAAANSRLAAVRARLSALKNKD